MDENTAAALAAGVGAIVGSTLAALATASGILFGVAAGLGALVGSVGFYAFSWLF